MTLSGQVPRLLGSTVTVSRTSVILPRTGHARWTALGRGKGARVGTASVSLWSSPLKHRNMTTASSCPTLSRTSLLPLIGRRDVRMMSTAALPFRGMHQQSEARELDDVVSFYDDKVAQYALQGIQTVTLKKLLGFSRKTQATTSEKESSGFTRQKQQRDLEANLEVARFARAELPVRLARRVMAMQKLPFIVGTNPYIKQVYKLYYDSFQTITDFSQNIQKTEDLDEFAGILQGLVSSHADVIPMLSQGFLECQNYMPKADIRVFLDEMIRARIGIRLIAEQVISLREQREGAAEQQETGGGGGRYGGYVGVVNTALKPAELVRTCANFVQELCDVNYGSSPEVLINGQTDTAFTYVPVHLEYILCELLKNSLRATVEHSAKIGRSGAVSGASPIGLSGDEGVLTNTGATFGRAPQDRASSSSSSSGIVTVLTEDVLDETRRPNEYGHPPVEVTIARSEHEVTIRIRDQGGGISREHFDKVFDYSFTTVKNENGPEGDDDMDETPYGVDNIFKGVSRLAMQAGLGGPIAGLGFGLPLARIYAQYFGGSMHLISLDGHGCDVFLKLKQIDESLDDLQI